LGYANENQVVASALLNNNRNCTLEFIVTKAEYRKKGFGTAVCQAAIEKMLEDSANCISLRAIPEGMLLYKSLEFIKYFDF
jgi:predicted GNAT family acetyltransferase